MAYLASGTVPYVIFGNAGCKPLGQQEQMHQELLLLEETGGGGCVATVWLVGWMLGKGPACELDSVHGVSLGAWSSLGAASGFAPLLTALCWREIVKYLLMLCPGQRDFLLLLFAVVPLCSFTPLPQGPWVIAWICLEYEVKNAFSEECFQRDKHWVDFSLNVCGDLSVFLKLYL